MTKGVLLKTLRINKKVSKILEELDPFTKRKLAELFSFLMNGISISLPLSRHMPIIAHGAHELRLKDRHGNYRIFYFLKSHDFVLIFHFINKKTQATPHHEIEIAKKRLEEML